MNVIEQVAKVYQASLAHDAWTRGQSLDLLGWIYGVRDGLLRDLGMTVTAFPEVAAARETAIAALGIR